MRERMVAEGWKHEASFAKENWSSFILIQTFNYNLNRRFKKVPLFVLSYIFLIERFDVKFRH